MDHTNDRRDSALSYGYELDALPQKFKSGTLGTLVSLREPLRSTGKDLVKRHGKAPGPSGRTEKPTSEHITEQDVEEALQLASGSSSGGSDITDEQVGEALERQSGSQTISDEVVAEALGRF